MITQASYRGVERKDRLARSVEIEVEQAGMLTRSHPLADLARMADDAADLGEVEAEADDRVAGVAMAQVGGSAAAASVQVSSTGRAAQTA